MKSFTEEASDRLKVHKREGEGFTDTILRLSGENRDAMKGFGMMSDVEGLREAVERTCEELDADLRT